MKIFNLKRTLLFTFFLLGGTLLLGNITNAKVTYPGVAINGSETESIFENVVAGTSIGTLTSPADEGVNPPYTYALDCAVASADDEHFQINGDQLEVVTTFDYDNPVDDNGDNDYEICLTSTNSVLAKTEVPTTITVNNITNTISDIKINGLDTASQQEGAAIETTIGLLEIVEDDIGEESPSYYFDINCDEYGDDNYFFYINESYLVNDEIFDFKNPVDEDGDNNYEICVGAYSSDDDEMFYEKNLTIGVTALPVVKSSKKSSSRRLSRTAVNQLFGTSVATPTTTPTTPTTTTTPSPSSSTVTQIQTQIISLLTQLIAMIRG